MQNKIKEYQQEFKKQFEEFKVLASKNPQLMLLINKLRTFIKEYSYQIKLIIASAFLLSVIITAISIGLNSYKRNKPEKVTPEPIRNIEISPTPIKDSVFRSIKNEVMEFNVVLPDPAPPPVDHEIYLGK